MGSVSLRPSFVDAFFGSGERGKSLDDDSEFVGCDRFIRFGIPGLFTGVCLAGVLFILHDFRPHEFANLCRDLRFLAPDVCSLQKDFNSSIKPDDVGNQDDGRQNEKNHPSLDHSAGRLRLFAGFFHNQKRLINNNSIFSIRDEIAFVNRKTPLDFISFI